MLSVEKEYALGKQPEKGAFWAILIAFFRSCEVENVDYFWCQFVLPIRVSTLP